MIFMNSLHSIAVQAYCMVACFTQTLTKLKGNETSTIAVCIHVKYG
jgi:hypothetical protein